MADHVVLVVHGVGEQTPGHTLDEAIAGALADHERNGCGMPDMRSEAFSLPERAFTQGAHGNRPEHAVPFPVHLRHLVSEGKTTTFAEVFWADRSPAPVGVLATFADLVRNVLGIGYLALDNVQNTSGRCAQWAVYAFCRVFYTVVAPLNAMLVIAACLLLPVGLMVKFAIPGAQTILDVLQSDLVLLPSGLVAFGFGAYFKTRSKSGFVLLRFLSGLKITGAAVFSLGMAVQFLTAVEGGRITRPFPEFLQSGFDSGGEYLALVLVTALSIAWTLCLLLCAVSYITWAWEWAKDRWSARSYRSQIRIFAPVLSGLMITWYVILMSFWLVIQFSLGKMGIDENSSQLMDEMLTLGGNSKSLYAVCLGVLAILSLCLVIVRAGSERTLIRFRETGLRFLLNPFFQMSFAFVTLMSILTTLDFAEYFFKDVAPNWVRSILRLRWLESLLEPVWRILNVLPQEVYNWFFILLGLAAYYAVSSLSAVLGIARDVVSYSTTPTPLAADRHPSAYTIRQAMDDRFARVLAHIQTHERPEHITIIAHSFGSLLAVRHLQRHFRNGTLPEGVKIKLITMGSPVSHIYGRYFCRDFALTPGFLSQMDWINLYRSGDYVGTRIVVDANDQMDHGIGAGGHTGYWTDPRFWEGLTSHAGFKLFRNKGDLT